MKTAIAVCLFAVVALALARPDDYYTSKYDNLNVKEIVENEALLKAYLECLLEKGKCTAEGKELKAHIGEALKTKCAKCTDKQKEGTKTAIHHLVNKEPASWKELSEKYDPEGKYTKEYEKELKEVSA